MPSFNQLSQSDSVSSSDQLPLYSNGQGDLRRISVGAIAEYVRDSLEPVTDTTIYSLTTSGTNFTVSLQPVEPGKSLWANLNPSAAVNIGTFVLPGTDYRSDGQEILVTSTQSIAGTTIMGSGAFVVGGPPSVAAAGFFRLRYDAISNTWYRVG